MKYILILTLSLFALTSAQAQRGGGRMNPQEQAKQQTKLMTDSLALSEAQVAKVAAVNDEYAEKMATAMKEARESETSDWTTMRTMMKTLRQEQDEDLKKYLTAEQAKKWTIIQEEQRKNRRNRGDRKGKGKKGKRGTKKEAKSL